MTQFTVSKWKSEPVFRDIQMQKSLFSMVKILAELCASLFTCLATFIHVWVFCPVVLTTPVSVAYQDFKFPYYL